MRIPTRYLKHLLVRGVAIWLLARLNAFVVLAVMSAIAGNDVQLNDVAINPGAMVVVAAALVLADLHRRKETMLLRNLGVATSFAVLIGTIPAVLFEGLRAALVA